MASSICAQPGCPELLPPGGGVRGYCERHSNLAVVEAIEHLTAAVETQGVNFIGLDSILRSIEDTLRAD
jgi:hypothetical protein